MNITIDLDTGKSVGSFRGERFDIPSESAISADYTRVAQEALAEPILVALRAAGATPPKAIILEGFKDATLLVTYLTERQEKYKAGRC